MTTEQPVPSDGTTEQQSRLLRIAKASIKPAIALLMLALLLRSGLLKLDEIKTSLTNSKILIAGVVLLSLQTLFFSFRWKYFVNQVVEFSLFQAVRQTLIGYFFNFFIPGGVGGDVIKALDLSKIKGTKKSTSFSLIFLDRILGLYAMIFFSMIFLLLEHASSDFNLQQYFFITLTMFLTATAGLFFAPAIILPLKKFLVGINQQSLTFKILNALYLFTEKISASVTKKNIFWSLIFSFFAQIFAILFLYQVAQELAPDAIANVPFMLFFPLACFAFMAASIPITPGGIGLGQAGFYLIFSQFDKTVASQLVIGISLYQLFCLAIGFIGGFFYLNSRKYISIPEQTPGQKS